MGLITLDDFVTWQTLPGAILFSILFIPIGILYWIWLCWDMYHNHWKPGDLYSWWGAILRPGFYFGLFVSILIGGTLNAAWRLIIKRTGAQR